MSLWPQTFRVGALVGALAASVACGEDRYFEIGLQEPPATTCPSQQYDFYSVLTWQGTDFLECVEGPCNGGGQSNLRDCLAGVETPALDPGRATRIKVMLFSGPPNQPPARCGEGQSPEVDFDTVKLDVMLECADSCGQVGCQPATCATERNALCP